MGLNEVCWSTMTVDGIVSRRSGHSAILPMFDIRKDISEGAPGGSRYMPVSFKYGPIDEDLWLKEGMIRGLYMEDDIYRDDGYEMGGWLCATG